MTKKEITPMELFDVCFISILFVVVGFLLLEVNLSLYSLLCKILGIVLILIGLINLSLSVYEQKKRYNQQEVKKRGKKDD